MKNLISLMACLFILFGVAQAQQNIQPAKTGTQYGKQIDAKGAISVSSLEKALEQNETFAGKVEGEVIQVCKKKGCFLTLKRAGDQEPIMVRFTDYAYFVPQDIIGKKVVLEGKPRSKKRL